MSDLITREDLAIDYALGLTEGAVLERAERLLQTDALFTALVTDWRNRLSALDQTAPEITPEKLRFELIEATIDRPSENRKAVAPAKASWWSDLWNSTTFWRPAAMAAGLAAVLLSGAFLNNLAKPPAQPVYVAVLQTSEGRAGAVVNAYADGTVTLVPLETIGVPEGRILEVWTLQSREQGPVSIGRIDKARSIKLDLKALKNPDVGHLFEITLEPQGGSPTGKPTGPILMKGLTSTAL
ncbi:MAG: anti-sigma factor [Beijerinckiaceae bacterium]